MRQLLLVAALIGIFSVTGMAGVIGTVVGTGYFQGHTYLAVQQPATWSAALSGANTFGGYLVSIGSTAENQFVFDLIKNVNALWYHDGYGEWGNLHGPRIGAIDVNKTNIWSWVNADPWSYVNWEVSEPNNIGSEDTVEYFTSQSTVPSAKWNNVVQAFETTGYIVEIDSVPEPATFLLLAPALGVLAWRRRRRA